MSSLEVEVEAMKKTIIIIIISLLVTAGTFVLSKYHNRDKMMTVMNINTLFLVILLAQQNTLTNLHSD